ncbi:HU family DNA-binding protein [Fusobacterium sp.]|uniref:HU family DNA-binding protein n=1 Tax=Fusobacterium sp. TaxID=68766 RepID=UPI00290030AD|nr:HU family DNA-binding protein [Fusobacterium sp.]MDU1911038.1 HU family DNA-binding protein [Fusobacterium sp.]
MIKKEFITLYKEVGKFETKKEAEEKLEAFLKTIEMVLEKKDMISFMGFGKFEVMDRAARKTRNPQTGKMMKVPAKKVVKFRPGKGLAEKVNK